MTKFPEINQEGYKKELKQKIEVNYEYISGHIWKFIPDFMFHQKTIDDKIKETQERLNIISEYMKEYEKVK